MKQVLLFIGKILFFINFIPSPTFAIFYKKQPSPEDAYSEEYSNQYYKPNGNTEMVQDESFTRDTSTLINDEAADDTETMMLLPDIYPDTLPYKITNSGVKHNFDYRFSFEPENRVFQYSTEPEYKPEIQWVNDLFTASPLITTIDDEVLQNTILNSELQATTTEDVATIFNNTLESMIENELEPRALKLQTEPITNSPIYQDKAEIENAETFGCSSVKEDKDHIVILGFFGFSKYNVDNFDSMSEVESAKIAINDVNNMLFKDCDYQIKLKVINTEGDPGKAVYDFFNLMRSHTERNIIAAISAASPGVTHALEKITYAWDIPLICSGLSSSHLSNSTKYSIFYRIVTPDSTHNLARIAFLDYFNWSSVVTIYEQKDLYSSSANDFTSKLDQTNITVENSILFTEKYIRNNLKILQAQKSKIVIGSFSEKIAEKLFCEVYDMNLYGGDYVWILPGTKNTQWWMNETYCPKENLIKAVNGLLLVSSRSTFSAEEFPISNRKDEALIKILPKPISEFARETQDAIWVAALSVQRVMSACSAVFDYKNNNDKTFSSLCFQDKQFKQKLVQYFQTIHFRGVSGPVMFRGTDRVVATEFYQVQDGRVVTVALYDPLVSGILDFHCDTCQGIIWPSGYIPVSERLYELRIVTINPIAFYFIVLLSVLGIVVCCCLLTFNIMYRENKYIKLSSPCLNTTTIVGCILIYIDVIFLGIDAATLPYMFLSFKTVCTARVMFLSSGCSLAFGSVFAKTYRVHQIFSRSNHCLVKNKILQDSRLVPLLAVFILIDGFIIFIWCKFDPMERYLHNLTLTTSASHPTFYQTQVEVCKSDNKTGWFLALYVYKGLIFVVGLYMAWETRNVNIPSLNDSKYICLSVYSVIVTSIFLFALADVSEHSNKVTLTYVITALLIIVITSTCILLLFAPKVRAMFKPDNALEERIMESMGLKFESNTIRLFQDEESELHYRAEVLNDVYKKHIVRLDKQVTELQRDLYFPTAVFPQLRRTTASRIYEHIPRFRKYSRAKSSSLSEGIPVLLLSVLPVVIPRASWPCADPNDHHVIEEEVEFNSDSKLMQGVRMARNSIVLQDKGRNLPEIRILPDTIDLGPRRRTSKIKEIEELESIPNIDDEVSSNCIHTCEAIIHKPPENDECDSKTAELNNFKQIPSITIELNNFSTKNVSKDNHFVSDNETTETRKKIISKSDSISEENLSGIKIITEEFD